MRMGNSSHWVVDLWRIILILSIFTYWLTEGVGENVENKILCENNICSKAESEFESTEILDIRNNTSGSKAYWKISEDRPGEQNWFKYFNNISVIPEDIDNEGSGYDVGFPKNFIKEKFLIESEAIGIWMMVHDDEAPHLIDPIPYIDFIGSLTLIQEYDTVNITCYLNGNSSLILKTSKNETHRYDNDPTETSKDTWDNFFIEHLAPFRSFKIEVYTENHTPPAFVIVEKIFVGKKAVPPTTTTQRTTNPSDTTTIPASTTIGTTEGDDNKETSTNSANYHFPSAFHFYLILIFYKSVSLFH